MEGCLDVPQTDPERGIRSLGNSMGRESAELEKAEGTFRQWQFCSSWLEHYVPTGEDNACRLEDVLFTIQPRRSK